MENSRVFIKIELVNKIEITETGYLKAQYILDQLIKNENITKENENVILRLDNLLYNGFKIKSAWLDLKNESIILNLNVKSKEIENQIEKLEEEIEQLEINQNEIIGLGGNDLSIREQIWEMEDKIHELRKKLYEGEE